MLSSKCPGQDTRFWVPEDIQEEQCPHCGSTMEFWKTDVRLRCNNCGEKSTNPKFDMGCAKWCSFAEYCLGDVAKGINSPETVKDIMLQETKSLLRSRKEENEEGHYEELQNLMERAEKAAIYEKLDILPALVSIYLKQIEEKWGAEEAQYIFNKLEESPKLPLQSIKEITAALNELRNVRDENIKESTPLTRVATKVLNPTEGGA